MNRLDFPASSPLSISCSTCTMASSSACSDCIVTFLCDGPASQRHVDIDPDEAHTLTLFSNAGLVPELKHRPRPMASVSFITRRAG